MAVVCSHILKYDSVTCLPPYDDVISNNLLVIWCVMVLFCVLVCVCALFFLFHSFSFQE